MPKIAYNQQAIPRNEERSRLFLYTHLGDRAYSMFRVERLALTMEQVRQYNPPPNPAKLTDSRARDYVADYGYESWELDALEPQVINDLIQSRIEEIREPEAWIEATEKEEEERSLLLKVSERWEEVRRMEGAWPKLS